MSNAPPTIHKLLVSLSLILAMAAPGFTHNGMRRVLPPELSAYVAAGGSLMDICATSGEQDTAQSQKCEACRLVEMALVPGHCYGVTLTLSDETRVLTLVALQRHNSRPRDLTRLTRASSLRATNAKRSAAVARCSLGWARRFNGISTGGYRAAVGTYFGRIDPLAPAKAAPQLDLNTVWRPPPGASGTRPLNSSAIQTRSSICRSGCKADVKDKRPCNDATFHINKMVTYPTRTQFWLEHSSPPATQPRKRSASPLTSILPM